MSPGNDCCDDHCEGERHGPEGTVKGNLLFGRTAERIANRHLEAHYNWGTEPGNQMEERRLPDVGEVGLECLHQSRCHHRFLIRHAFLLHQIGNTRYQGQRCDRQ